MKLADAGTFLGSHLIAGLVYGVVFGVVPLCIAAILMVVLIVLGIIFNDLGGPLWIPMYLVGCVIYAIAILVGGAGLFCLTSLVRASNRRLGLSWWVPLLILPAICAAISLGTKTSHPIVWVLAFTLPFYTYWISLVSAETIANWIRRKLAERRSAQPCHRAYR